MTLASSGSINLAGASSSPQRSILAELGATAPISLISTSTRTLSGVSSGPITMPTDFYGKSSTTPGYSIYLPFGYGVVEGNQYVVVVLTSNVTTGTSLYWSIDNGSTTNNDFSGAMFGSTTVGGSFSSGSAQITINIATDAATEGTESATLRVRTASTSGPVILSSSFFISDPSLGPYLYTFGPGNPTGPNYFTVPAGMTSVDLVMAGGGGGGGSTVYYFGAANTPGSGGGGGGQVRRQLGYSVTPGEILTVVIGSGGIIGNAGGISSIQGNAGAATIEAEGGGYGANSVNGMSFGGTGGNSKNNAGSIVYANNTALKPGGGGSGTVGPGAPGGENAVGEGGGGGEGISYTLGTTTFNLGGGGGGGSYSSNPGGQPGFGGGGTGSSVTYYYSDPFPGTDYTGGGGGGGRGYPGGMPSTQLGAAGGRGVVYLSSTVQPTPKLAPSVGLASFYSQASGGIAQAWTELSFGVDGRMTTEEGNNSVIATTYNVPGSWLTSSPAGTSTSTAGLYDIELTPSNATLAIDGVQYTPEFSGAIPERVKPPAAVIADGTTPPAEVELNVNAVANCVNDG